jgi:predicted MFS family arabinose efflux permease
MITLSIRWLTLLLIGTDLFVVSPLLPQIAASSHVGVGTAGWMVSAFSLAYIAGGPALGSRADRYGRHRVLAVALAVFAGANLATGLAPDFPVLLGTRALAGLAAAGVTPSVYALVGASAPPGRRATWLSVVTSGLLLALATGAPAGALLSQVAGWRGVFLTLAAGTLTVLVLNMWAGRDHPPEPTGTHTTPETPRAADLVTPRRRLGAVSITAAWGFAVYGPYTYLGAGLHQDAHFGPRLVAVALAIYGVSAVLGNLLGGPLADRAGPRATTTASLLILAAVEAGLGAIVQQRLLLLIGLAGFALAAYPFFTAQQTRLINAFPAAGATLLAWNNTALYAGILAGSAAGGTILGAAGFPALIETAAGISLLGAVLSPRVIADARSRSRGRHLGSVNPGQLTLTEPRIRCEGRRRDGSA